MWGFCFLVDALFIYIFWPTCVCILSLSFFLCFSLPLVECMLNMFNSLYFKVYFVLNTVFSARGLLNMWFLCYYISLNITSAMPSMGIEITPLWRQRLALITCIHKIPIANTCPKTFYNRTTSPNVCPENTVGALSRNNNGRKFQIFSSKTLRCWTWYFIHWLFSGKGDFHFIMLSYKLQIRGVNLKR